MRTDPLLTQKADTALEAMLRLWLEAVGHPAPPSYTLGMLLQHASDVEAQRTEG